MCQGFFFFCIILYFIPMWQSVSSIGLSIWADIASADSNWRCRCLYGVALFLSQLPDSRKSSPVSSFPIMMVEPRRVVPGEPLLLFLTTQSSYQSILAHTNAQSIYLESTVGTGASQKSCHTHIPCTYTLPVQQLSSHRKGQLSPSALKTTVCSKTFY